MDKKISVLMSVYKNDKADWLGTAIESVENQTLKPDEVVLFVDGPVPQEIEDEISLLTSKYKNIKLFRNEKNIGLGNTLNKAIMECKNEIIARMDSDDYSLPNRFEEEFKCLEENNLDIVGSCVSEFSDDIEKINCMRLVPSEQEEIRKFSKSRSPFCHPTVMYKKSKVLEAGNYLDMPLCEDYYLWVRMLQHNAKAKNIDKCLVKMRVNDNTYERRGGLNYYKAQKKLFHYMYKTKYIGFFTYLKNKFIRFNVQVLLPNKLRKKLYHKKLRKNNI